MTFLRSGYAAVTTKGVGDWHVGYGFGAGGTSKIDGERDGGGGTPALAGVTLEAHGWDVSDALVDSMLLALGRGVFVRSDHALPSRCLRRRGWARHLLTRPLLIGGDDTTVGSSGLVSWRRCDIIGAVEPLGVMGSFSSRFENDNRRLLRARDLMDREYWSDLDMKGLGQVAAMSRAHFIRSFKETFGETPHRYLQRRRVERAMYLLRTTNRPVTEICMRVGFSSLGSFSRTFSEIVGESPSRFRNRGRMPPVPNCFVKTWTRPSTFGEAKSVDHP